MSSVKEGIRQGDFLIFKINFSSIFGRAHAEIKEKQLALKFYSQKLH